MSKLFPRLLLPAFLCCWFLFTALTIPDYGVTWDEPLYYRAAQAYGDWFGLIFSGNWDTAFDSKTIDSYWQYNSQHPPLTKLVAAFTYSLTHRWLDETIAFRLAELIWYIALLLLVYHVANYAYGKKVAWVAMLATAFMPRLFADAHLLELDLPLATVWLFTVYAFYRGTDVSRYKVQGTRNGKSNRNWKWSLITGIAFGFALLTKVMALFILIPLLLWAQIFQRHKYTNNLSSMVILGLLIFVLGWPWLWHNTATKILDYYAFFFLMESPLKTFYFGYAYSSTPWHYPLVMTLITVPVGILALALFGIWKTIRVKKEKGGERQNNLPSGAVLPAKRSSFFHQSDTFGWLLLLNILFFLLFFSLPGTLAIDGVRYFQPLFPMLAIFAGIGFNVIARAIGTRL